LNSNLRAALTIADKYLFFRIKWSESLYEKLVQTSFKKDPDNPACLADLSRRSFNEGESFSARPAQ
jgi:hypothetical protein